MTLDANSTVWTFRNWGRPFQLVSPLLGCSSPETTPVQVECGQKFSAVLTRSGDVYIWWPFYGTIESQYQKAMKELDKDESTKAIVPDGGMVIPCHTWEINEDPIKLPNLPDLPDLPGTGPLEEVHRKKTKFIQIVACSKSLIGLTNKGHVLKMDKLHKEYSAQAWYYVSESAWLIWHPFLNHDIQLPNYSEIDKVKEHPDFKAGGKIGQPQVEFSSDNMFITHVNHITLISSGCCV